MKCVCVGGGETPNILIWYAEMKTCSEKSDNFVQFKSREELKL